MLRESFDVQRIGRMWDDEVRRKRPLRDLWSVVVPDSRRETVSVFPRLYRETPRTLTGTRNRSAYPAPSSPASPPNPFSRGTSNSICATRAIAKRHSVSQQRHVRAPHGRTPSGGPSASWDPSRAGVWPCRASCKPWRAWRTIRCVAARAFSPSSLSYRYSRADRCVCSRNRRRRHRRRRMSCSTTLYVLPPPPAARATPHCRTSAIDGPALRSFRDSLPEDGRRAVRRSRNEEHGREMDHRTWQRRRAPGLWTPFVFWTTMARARHRMGF